MNDELTTAGLWCRLWEEVRQKALAEPILASYLHATILNHRCLEDALSFHLASKLAGPNLAAMSIREVISESFESPGIQEAIRQAIGKTVIVTAVAKMRDSAEMLPNW